jgi:hypothetical protein
MTNKILLRAIWLFVLVPTAAVSAFWALMVLPVFVSALSGSEPGIFRQGHMYVALLVIPGLFGIATLSTLYDRFANDKPLGNTKLLVAGLAAGCFTSFALVVLVPGQRLSLWPLIAAVYFLVRLRLASRQAA